MIEIKCSQAQYKRFITYLNDAGYIIDGKCVLGQGYPCYGSKKGLSCKDCLRENIKRI